MFACAYMFLIFSFLHILSSIFYRNIYKNTQRLVPGFQKRNLRQDYQKNTRILKICIRCLCGAREGELYGHMKKKYIHIYIYIYIYKKHNAKKQITSLLDQTNCRFPDTRRSPRQPEESEDFEEVRYRSLRCELTEKNMKNN